MTRNKSLNRTKLWFKRKAYGWGWHPITWEGWLTVLIYVGIIILYFQNVDSNSHSVSDTLINVVPVTTIVTAIFIAIAYSRGEKPRWQWGGKQIKPPFSKWLR
jgi:uncharacterized membrane protein YbhN (UPF0104 family)